VQIFDLFRIEQFVCDIASMDIFRTPDILPVVPNMRPRTGHTNYIPTPILNEREEGREKINLNSRLVTYSYFSSEPHELRIPILLPFHRLGSLIEFA
jgi:hypothetical protein